MAEQDIFERDIILDELKRILEYFEINESQFRTRAKDIQSIHRNFLKLQTKIEKSLLKLQTFDREEQLRIRKQFNDTYYAIQTHVDDLKRKDDESRRMSRVFNNSMQSNHGHYHINKLPVLPLPSFSGEPTEWTSYHDLFRSVVHNNDNYTEAEKFRYLLLTLKDEPFNLIKSIPITDENYSIALEILISRYENKRAIASKHLDRIFEIESCSDKNSTQGLRSLLNIYQENIKALEVMHFPVQHWSFLLLHILLRKIPASIRKRFELSLKKPSDIPSVEVLIQFLEKDMIASEIVESGVKNSQNVGSLTKPPARGGNSAVPTFGRTVTAHVSSSEYSHSKSSDSRPSHSENRDNKCVCCDGQHPLTKCNKFLNLSPNDRYSFIKTKDVCFNCLSKSHNVSQCKSTFSCRSCGKRHHTCLHFPNQNIVAKSKAKNIAMVTDHLVESPHCDQPTTSSHATQIHCASSNAPFVQTKTVLLSTALVDVFVGGERRSTVRCMIDTGSQATFITESCVTRLGLSRRQVDIPVFGIGDNKPIRPKGISSFCVCPRNALQPSIPIDALILPKLIHNMPSVSLPATEWSHLHNLKLADPAYHLPQPVEIILGADVLPFIMLGGVISGQPGTPIALNSVLGYLLLGKIAFDSPTRTSVSACFSSLPDNDLRKFWELESLPSEVKLLTPQEKLCETLFESSHCRDVTGRYIVALPRKPDAQPLGESRDIALARFHKLEHRLERNPGLKAEYHKCLQEYLDLKYMEPVSDPPIIGSTYYIPHHCVIKESSSTTRTRVVFDAGCSSSSGTSLNDILLTGPKLHQDIVDVLLKFRVHSVALVADIKQMYLNINVRESDRDLQRILWRTTPCDPIRDYRLCTVTFGVSSSPYLALRTIRQLAYDEAKAFPLASKVLLDQMFVDDVCCTEVDDEKALLLQQELIGICKSAGFELHKWHSNSPALLAAVQAPVVHGERQEEVSFAPMENDNQTKVLGLQWNPQSDHFTFSVQSTSNVVTKRTILSQIAKIYDPMGWLSPVTIFAKHLMQLLWMSGVSWDERPPIDIINAWTAFVQELPLLSRVTIPRQIFFPSCSIQLHGYSDASEHAMAACVYVRLSDDVNKEVRTFLVLAKTRVAPLSPCLSIPRLELMGVVMVSKLLERALSIYSNRIKIDEVFAWSDSSVVLAWLRSPPYEWKTFVSNRTSEILTRLPTCRFGYVPGALNPSDAPSRGQLPSTFLQNDMWFHGPQWLRKEPTEWPTPQHIPDTTEEKRSPPVASLPVTQKENIDIDIINKFSTLGKLLRVTSYVLRFYNILKSRVKKDKIVHPNYITVHEYNSTLNRLIYLMQHQIFSEDFKNISQGKQPSNQLKRLDPFIDDLNFLRVGGRLHKSLLPYESKHQLILPKKHPLTSLIIDDAHIAHLHAGTQSVQYLLLQKYWILSSRDIIRKQIYHCVRCFRTRPAHSRPAMAPLPAVRIRPERPFLKSSVDYAGPFYVRANKVRNAKIIKCYVAVFVCTSLKCCHLEIVSELTSQGMLAALRRFTSRRGLITDLYSDGGKNFVGCNNYLKELYDFLKNDSVQAALNSQTLQQGITWHFQPAYAPHFGGLHEAWVGGFKRHLHRVVGNRVQTYDEMHTLLCQIEAVINSRPLCVLSADASDPLPLTPAHFLVGGPLTAIPDVSLTELNPGRLTRWQWVQQCVQHFWKRWSREYLHEIQQRSKWYSDRGSPINVGDIVVVSDDNLPPLRWKLARVHALHPSPIDTKVRVVTLQSGKNYFKRAVVKLCKLPIE